MKDTTQTRVASVLTTGVGAWLLASPLFITVSKGALANVLIVGGIIALAGIVQFFLGKSSLPSWISALAALWLLGSVLIFSAGVAFAWSAVLSAVAAFALAIWDGIEVNHVQHNVRHTAI